MTDIHARTLRQLGIRYFQDRLKEADEANRAELRRLMVESGVKTQEASIAMQLTDEPLVVGKATLNKAARSVRVTDRKAFVAWVQQNHPDWIITIQTVNSAYEKAVLAEAKDAGAAVDKATGEVIPGIEVYVADRVLTVTPDNTVEARAALVSALFADGATGVRALLTEGDT